MVDVGAGEYLFDLGNPEAREWMCDYIGDFIEQSGIDYYRQDFNMEPAWFWAKNDEPGRAGIREIRHIEGLYAFWDYLLERFPNLLIDNCASGGRRIDLESVSRSAPLWRTDYNYGEPVGYQCHTYGLELYLPLHGTGVQNTDKFTFRSSPRRRRSCSTGRFLTLRCRSTIFRTAWPSSRRCVLISMRTIIR